MYSVQAAIQWKLGTGNHNYKYHFAILNSHRISDLEDIELYCYKQFIKIWFYVDTMYNYEIEEADLEFVRDDEDILWLINMTNIQIKMKEDYEESQMINGVTYCHPKGKDPELEDHKTQLLLDQQRYNKLFEAYDSKFVK